MAAGTLTIGDNLGSTAVVRDAIYGGNINANVSVRVNNQSLLDLYGNSEGLGPITVDGGTIQTGAGALTMVSNLVSTNSTGTNSTGVISGKLYLNPTNPMFSLYADLIISAGSPAWVESP